MAMILMCDIVCMLCESGGQAEEWLDWTFIQTTISPVEKYRKTRAETNEPLEIH